MEDSKWLRFVTIGLVLAALAVGYFLFTSRFSPDTTKPESQISQATPSASLAATVRPGATVVPSASPAVSAYNRIVSRNQGNGVGEVAVLPRTGFPAGLIAILAISTMVSGWGLRRFPH